MENEEDESAFLPDGLATEYDLVILGTGLVQAILSCVASKHGKKVLHLERNEFYGENYSCHHLSSHIQHYSARGNTGLESVESAEECQNQIHLSSTPQQEIVMQFVDNVSDTKGLALPKVQARPLQANPACFGYSMERQECTECTEGEDQHVHPCFFGYQKHKSLTKARLWLRDRDFNIDTTAKVVFGSCPLVDLMVASGVANYLEFKTFEGLYFWMDQDAAGTTCSSGHMWKVPCSRVDVFNTTALGALEKRGLMKFHQFVADWGRTHSGVEVTSLNETDLAVGRSLYRPQNKQQSTVAGYNVDAFLDLPFEAFLDDCKLSPKLQRIIIFALCCYTCPSSTQRKVVESTAKKMLVPEYTTRAALNDMFMHVDSIGRFGETAFLSPMYGACEVVQAFCRMSAVWGGTFILRRSVVSIELSSSEGGSSEAAEAVEAHRAVLVRDSEGNTVRCGAFVCSAGYWPDTPTRSCALVACTSTWLGAPLPLARSVIIIPPSSLTAVKNAYPVHIIQTDASTCAAPDGAAVLHVSTMIDLEPACGADGKSWADRAEARKEAVVGLVNAIIAQLSHSMENDQKGVRAVELTRVVTLNPVYDLGLPCTASGASFASTLPENVRLCTGASDASLSMQAACEQARSIFTHLFPDKDFSLGEVAPHPGEEGQQGAAALENDDEAAYLEFALKAAMPEAALNESVQG